MRLQRRAVKAGEGGHPGDGRQLPAAEGHRLRSAQLLAGLFPVPPGDPQVPIPARAPTARGEGGNQALLCHPESSAAQAHCRRAQHK